MATVRISEQTLIDAMQSQQTREALKARADRIAGQAAARVAVSRLKTDVERTDGTRPKGRPYSRVALTADGEHPVPPLVRRQTLEQSL
jgi:hypothetical protein